MVDFVYGQLHHFLVGDTTDVCKIDDISKTNIIIIINGLILPL